MYSAHSARSHGGSSDQQFTPIAGISGYAKNISLKVRVLERSDVRSYSNAKGSGTILSFTLMDKDQSTISGRMFTTSVDRFDPIFQQGKCYIITNPRLNMAQQNNSSTTSEYELTFSDHTEMKPVDDDPSIPPVSLRTISPLGQLMGELPGNVSTLSFDYIGVIHTQKPSQPFQTKTGKTMERREFTIIDQNNYIIDVKMWGEQAVKYPDELFLNNPVVLLKGFKINEFNGTRSLSSSFTSSLLFNPNISKTRELLDWYKNSDHNTFVSARNSGAGGGANGQGNDAKRSYKQRLSDIDEQYLLSMHQDTSGQPPSSIVRVVGYISRLTLRGGPEHASYYMGCPTESCYKKRVRPEGGSYVCDKCSQNISQPLHVWVFNADISDESGTRSVTFFDQTGFALLGMTAQDFDAQMQLNAGNEIDTAHQITAQYLFKPYYFAIRATVDASRDPVSVKYRCSHVEPYNPARVASLALEEIKQYDAM